MPVAGGGATITEIGKICYKCGKELPISDFYEAKCNKTGTTGQCRSCYNEWAREYYKTRSFSISVTEKKCSSCGEIKLAQDFCRNKREKSGLNNNCKVCTKEYRDTHKDIIESAPSRNGEYRRVYEKKRYHEKYKNDIRYRMRNNIGTSIVNRLRSNKCRKSTFDYLPYTIEELMAHLEKQFRPGMSWDNYGKWHIDHIIPDSWFDYDSLWDKEFQMSWSLKNLQPLWSNENYSKQNRFCSPFFLQTELTAEGRIYTGGEA